MIYLILASIVWSLSFGLIRAELSDLNPFLVSFIRLLLSFLVFLPFCRKTTAAVGVKLASIGMVQFGAMYCLYIYSYRYLEGHQVALLTVTTPLFVVWLDALFNRKWISGYWLAALLAVAAALVLVLDGGAGRPVIMGVLLLQGANLCFALGQLLYKNLRVGTRRQYPHFAWMYLGGLTVPLLFSLSGGFDWTLPERAGQWWSLLYLGLVPAGLGFFWWNKGVLSVNNGMAAAMNNLKIPLGAFLAWLVFGENVDWPRFVVCAFLFGLSLLLVRERKP